MSLIIKLWDLSEHYSTKAIAFALHLLFATIWAGVHGASVLPSVCGWGELCGVVGVG